MPPLQGQTTARSRRAGRRRTPPPRPVSRPAAPTATQIASALAQRRALVSQGRAVEHVANRQRAAQTVRRQQAQSKPLAAKPMRHTRAGRPVRLVPVPGRKGYVRPERAAVNQIVAAVDRQSRSVADDRARAIQAASQTGGDFAESTRYGRKEAGGHGLYLKPGYSLGPVDRNGGRSILDRYSHPVSYAPAAKPKRGYVGIASSSARPLRAGIDVARAIHEKPSIASRVPGDLLKYAVGAPAGLVESIAHPNQAINQGIQDWGRRYSDLMSGDDRAFIDRLKKEGITPEIVDLATGGTGAGVVAGRLTQKVAERGALGKTAHRIATERPDLVVSGNVTRAQEVSPNFIRNVGRAVTDARRAQVQARRASRQDAPLEVRLAEEKGAVTYTSRRRQGREQRRLVAQEKGAGVQRLKMVQQREHGDALKNLNSLSKDERRGFAVAHQFGATSPEAARGLLERRQADIRAHRESSGSTISKRRDQLPELQWLHQNAEKVFTPRLRKVVREEQARERRVAAGDPGVDQTQAQLRRYQPLAAALGIERKAGETNAQHLRNVITAAREQGLERPGYLKSEERAKGVFATMALGGAKATDIPKAYTGSLLRQGIESTDPNVHLQGVARGLKRRQQWNMVASNLERHAVKDIGGKSVRERDVLGLTRDLENAGVDLGSVAFWNPRKFYEESRQAARDTEGADVSDTHAENVEHGSGDVHAALQASIVSPAKVRGNPEAFTSMRGYSVVPAAVLKEIEGGVRPEGLASRVVDVSRGKISRVLLGNPAWLTFQVASNALLTGLAGTGPFDALKAQRWWKGLSEAEREAMAPEVGITGWHDEQTRLGATANSRLVNAYRAFKQTGMYQLAHKANPLDAIFRADNAQNNFFRKAVFYNQAKREAYRRMGDNATRMIRAQQGINRVLKMDPKDRITAAAKDPKVFENHARAVRDFLGDYTSYTTKERARLGRYAMFYGFLRHSLRLTFYTLPVKHPLMTAIGLELGRMHDQELRKLFGVSPPVWEQANAFIKIGGKTRKFAIGRLNPFFNAVQYQGPGSLTGLATPLAGIALDQIAHQTVTFDQPWTVGGSGSYVMRGKDVTVAQRAKIALAGALHLSPYVRMAEKTGLPFGLSKPLVGRQTTESSILFPDPVQYKPGDPAIRNATRTAEQRRVSAKENVLRSMLPIFGEDSAPIIRSSRDYTRSQGKPVAGDAKGGGGQRVDPVDLHDIRESVQGGSKLDPTDLDEIRQQIRGG